MKENSFPGKQKTWRKGEESGERAAYLKPNRSQRLPGCGAGGGSRGPWGEGLSQGQLLTPHCTH